MPSMAARPFWRSTFSLKVLTSGSSYRTHESSAMSPASASSVWGFDAKPVPACMHAGEHHDLEPARGRDGLERREAAGRDILELEVLRGREVARHADARLDGDDVEEAKHGGAAVLDLHDLVAAHVTGLDQAERVEDAQRRQDANVALREHGRRRGARHGAHGGRGLEGRDRLEEGKGNDGGGLHDCFVSWFV